MRSKRRAWIGIVGGIALAVASCTRAPEPAVVPEVKSSLAPARPPEPATDASGSARAPVVPSSASTDEVVPTTSTAPRTAGWHARGSVRSSAGAIPNARIVLEVRGFEGAELDLVRTKSDAAGAFSVALPRLDDTPVRDVARARIEARVEADGFQPAEASAKLPSGPERTVALDVLAVEGAALRGRAVDARGTTAPRATAAISLRDGRSGPGGLTLVDECIADADGRFALGFAGGGKMHLSLRAEDVGVHAREVEVVARRDQDVGDVALGGGGRMSGTAIHADGTPAKNLELWALEGETAFQSDPFATVVRRAREVERNEGLSFARAFTDDAGKFEFRALRPDHYAVKAADPAVVIEPRQARYEPGQTDVQLRVETPLLVVRVVDDTGAAVPGALVEATDLGVEADGSYTPGGTRRAMTRGARALAGFSADPETPLAIRARLGTRFSPEKFVYFGVGTQHIDEELVLAPRVTNGRLRLDVAGADPKDLGIRLALASPTTRYVDEDAGIIEVGPDGVATGIPPGDHHLVLDFQGETGAWFFPWRTKDPVRVPVEGEVVVAVEPISGARLAIECALVGPPPPGLDDDKQSPLRRERYGARFVLVPASGGHETSLSLRLGGEDVGMLLIGETGDARDLIPAGDYVVRVEGTRWSPTETRIRLLPKKRMTARVELRAR